MTPNLVRVKNNDMDASWTSLTRFDGSVPTGRAGQNDTPHCKISKIDKNWGVYCRQSTRSQSLIRVRVPNLVRAKNMDMDMFWAGLARFAGPVPRRLDRVDWTGWNRSKIVGPKKSTFLFVRVLTRNLVRVKNYDLASSKTGWTCWTGSAGPVGTGPKTVGTKKCVFFIVRVRPWNLVRIENYDLESS